MTFGKPIEKNKTKGNALSLEEHVFCGNMEKGRCGGIEGSTPEEAQNWELCSLDFNISS